MSSLYYVYGFKKQIGSIGPSPTIAGKIGFGLHTLLGVNDAKDPNLLFDLPIPPVFSVP